MLAVVMKLKIYKQELIRRWDSERELFLRDIVHVEASAYAHWTHFLISTINIYARPNYAHKQLSTHLRDYVHETELSVCFTQIIAE